jgi:aminoglycoside phosphotransferase family enzyme/predicted kinase
MSSDEPQARTLAFLQQALAARGGVPVRQAQTHVSRVLLSPALAWKIKKPVTLPYLDFGTAGLRLAACERELELNRRTAPDLYRAVHRVTRDDLGRLAIDGPGELVDAILEMRRFDEDCLLDRMAARGELTPALVTALAGRIAAFHRAAAPAPSLARSGSRRTADVLAINERALLTGAVVLGEAAVRRLIDASRAAWQRVAPLLDARQAAGRVRHCHGDLHLRNIVAIDGVPTLFDCLEFDDDMATIDVLYDLAFALMDLWHAGCEPLANLLFNRYLDQADEVDGLPLLPLFMAMRATVRAHVTATQALAAESDGRDALVREARGYLALAQRLLSPVPPRLVAVGGRSGSGKSTAAAAIAHAVGAPPGARVLSSDRLRKALHEVSPQTRLPPEAYRPEVSERVYRAMAEQAAVVLGAGHGVVADAVFDRAEDRERIARVASSAGVPFLGAWLDAPAAVLLDRVAKRRGDPSDADAAVVMRQLERDVGPLDWQRIDAGRDAADALLARLGETAAGSGQGTARPGP